MKPAPLLLERPTALAEACEILAAHEGLAKPLAGGQSLMPLVNLRLAVPTALVDLNRLPGLDGIVVDAAAVHVGALVRQRALERDAAARAACPLLGLALPLVGHVATRNRGTVCGSLAHADAAAELPCVLLCLDGEVDVRGADGSRTVPARELSVTHLTSSLAPDELIVGARFPVLGPGHGFAFEEVALRHGDYALAMVACALRVEDGAIVEARLAAAAIADRPLRLAAAEAALVAGAPLAEAAALAAAAVDPPDAPHAPAAYRRALVEVLVRRAVEHAVREATP